MTNVGRAKFEMLMSNFDVDGDAVIELTEFIYGFKCMAANEPSPSLMGSEGMTYAQIIENLQISANSLIFDYAQELYAKLTE